MAPYLRELIERSSQSFTMAPEVNAAPVTPNAKSKGKVTPTLTSPGNDGSFSSGSFSLDDNDDDFERSSPSRSKSALARLQTIREKRVMLRTPIISPKPFLMDVFGESPTSLNVWDEEDNFAVTTPKRRRERTGSSRRSRNQRINGLRDHLGAIDLGA